MLTSFGWFMIAFSLFSLFISIKISKRNEFKGCLSIGFVFLLVFSIYSIFLGTSYSFCDMSYQYFKGDSFCAKVVSYRKYKEQRKDTYEDSNGRSRNREYTVILNVPMFEFVETTGKIMQLESGSHSSEIPIVGDEVVISYLEGRSTVLEHKFSTFFLAIVALLFSTVFGFFSKVQTAYAFGVPMSNSKEVFAKGFLIGIKICIISFELALIYSLYKIMTNRLVVPLWVSFFLVLCVVALSPVVFLLFRKKQS